MTGIREKRGGAATKVRGPFIEYECSACGRTVQENAPRNPVRLVERIADANADDSTRVCAACSGGHDTGGSRA